MEECDEVAAGVGCPEASMGVKVKTNLGACRLELVLTQFGGAS
jgi:hypothetical protein